MTVRALGALSRPTIGSLPAPRPLSPSWIFVASPVFVRACASVFAQITRCPPFLTTPCGDGIAAGAADANYFDHSLRLGIIWVEQGRLL